MELFIRVLVDALHHEYDLDCAFAAKGWQVLGQVSKWKHGDRPQSNTILSSPTNQQTRVSRGMPRLLKWRIHLSPWTEYVEAF